MHTRRPAFTLIELMVVIVIISLLTAVATVSFTNAQRASRDNARKTTVSSIATAIETYYRDNHTFPGYPTTGSGGYTANGCQTVDGDATVSYSYIPLRTCTGVSPYLTSDAGPTWIPGLGTYMSTAPIDKRFLDVSGDTYDQIVGGGTNNGIAEMWLAYDASTSNQTRTYTYRHLDGGYIIYTRLEGSSSDTVTGPVLDAGVANFAHNPTDDGPTHVNGNIYAIRR